MDKEALKTINDLYKSLQKDVFRWNDLGSVYNKIKYTLQPNKHKSKHLSFVYMQMAFIIDKYPELAEPAFNTFKLALQSYINNLDTLCNAYTQLANIINTNPDLTEPVFELINFALKSDKNNYLSARAAADILTSGAEKNPLLILKCISPADEYGKKALNEICSLLRTIVEKHPELKEQVFDVLRTGKYDAHSCADVIQWYSLLSSVVEKETAVSKQVFDIIKPVLQANVSKTFAFKYAHKYVHKILTSIVNENPELAERIFNIIKPDLISFSDESRCADERYKLLCSVFAANPSLANISTDIAKKALHSKKIHYYEQENIYRILGSIIRNIPEAADEAVEIYKTALQSDTYWSSTKIAYEILYDIVWQRPTLAKQIFNIIKTDLKPVDHEDTVRTICTTLDEIVVAEPSLAEQVLDIIKLNIQPQSFNNNIDYSYNSLVKIVQNAPEATDKVLDLIEGNIRSNVTDRESLITTYKYLAKIIQANPQSADKALEIFKTGMQSDKNGLDYHGISSLTEAHRHLTYAVENVPAVAKKALDVALRTHNMPSLILYTPTLYLYKTCMKHLPLKETIAEYPDYELDLRIAHKGRFAEKKEFEYALEILDKTELADSIIFSAQQRVMNILVSASAQEKGIGKEDAVTFRKSDAPKDVKDFIKDNEDWLIPASFKGAVIFKEYFPAYIKQIQNHNRKNPDDALSIHDAVYWLPEPKMSQEENARFAEFIRNNIIYQNAEHQMVHRPLSELKIIAQNWKALENRLQEQGDDGEISKLKYSDVLSVCTSVSYADQHNEMFAIEAAKHAIPANKYHNCEDIYLAGLKVPEPFDSKKEFKEGKYTGRFLPRDDVRTGFFGDYTDCCQHFGGVGDACAVSTVKHPFSQLFVIEDEKGKIIAGSWTWENTEGKYREVCFDNIESLGELSERPELNKIYEQVGKYLTEEQNCRRVTIGLGYQDADVSGYKETEAIALPELYGKDGTNSYSDAHSQVLLSENKKAEPLDKTQESQRYVRDLCHLDVEAMEKVSRAVFPDGDKELQAPENMAGFVIEDREKGVVGYCLYDKKEKSIYDMAVLPEYRTDKNASSKKLFAEMMRTIREQGGKWSAEMRDKTTLKYLEIMAERGLVKFEKHGVDHVMSDGSQVIAVTFEPVRDEVRQATSKLKEKLEENTAKTVDLKPNAQDRAAHGAVIVKDSDAREA